MNREKITVYTISEFFGGVVTHRGYLIEHGRKKYAQYTSVPFVKFTPKGKRKPCTFIKGYEPYILIVAGWDTPESKGMFYNEGKTENGVTIKKAEYLAHDERYRTDFNVVIDEAMEVI